MSVSIHEVTSSSGLRAFVRFPLSLHAQDPCWVPPLLSEDIDTLRRDRNPAFAFCDAAYYLAYRDGKVVGRIAGIVNHRAVQKWGARLARFGWLDFVDDPEVSAALFDACETWSREQGMTGVHGPLAFTDLDPQGMLVHGFDELGTLATIQNPPYYRVHLERLAYEKEVDWIEYRMAVPKQPLPRLARLRKRVEQSLGLEVVRFRSMKEFRPYARPILELVNDAYAPLHEFVPLNDAQIQDVIHQKLRFLRPEYLFVVLDQDERLAAFGLTMPSLAAAMKKARGRLLPFGWFHLLRAMRRETTLDLLLVAVRPDLQGRGVNVLLIDECVKVCIENGIEYAESNPELETNTLVQGQWKFFDARQHKRRRCYLKTWSETIRSQDRNTILK